MNFPVRRTTSAIAALASAGVASLFLGGAPASAAPVQCGASGTLITGNICEQVFTAGSSTFTPTAQMSKLEVLLVAGGGTGADETSTNGYAAGGGGGQVKLVGFGASTPASLTLAVGGSGLPSTVSDGTTTSTAAPGASAAPDAYSGAASGSGNAGALGSPPALPYGAGGGAGASPVGNAAGGAGVIVSSLAAAGSVFSTDSNCYGGGGAVGIPGTAGTATCGGGQPTDSTSTSLIAPTANSGGGGGSISITTPVAQRQGASGLVVIRWIPTVTLSFSANGHGATTAAETFAAGTAPVKPADPTASGWVFNGWFSNAGLTVRADFTAPITASTTFYASWSAAPVVPSQSTSSPKDPELAATGGAPNGAELPIGIAALALGATLFAVGYRRKRKSH